jgi:hypothetical protein
MAKARVKSSIGIPRLVVMADAVTIVEVFDYDAVTVNPWNA